MVCVSAGSGDVVSVLFPLWGEMLWVYISCSVASGSLVIVYIPVSCERSLVCWQ